MVDDPLIPRLNQKTREQLRAFNDAREIMIGLHYILSSEERTKLLCDKLGELAEGVKTIREWRSIVQEIDNSTIPTQD